MIDMMKQLFTAIFAVLFTSAGAQQTLVKVWETDTIVKVPESVLPDPSGKFMYVSLIDGAPWDPDGKGGVAKMSRDGKTIDQQWITGLNCPKGLGKVGNRLYVADYQHVVVVDINKGAVEKKIAVPGAGNLNDITVTPAGVVFVSDSKLGKIYKIENDVPALYLDSLPGVNGLKFVNHELVIAAGKNFIKADAQKRLIKIAVLPQGGDGVEPVGNGDFIVTSWMGYVFYVSANGNVQTLLETVQLKKNTADIAYDQEKRLLYVPTFNGKTVAAYKLTSSKQERVNPTE